MVRMMEHTKTPWKISEHAIWKGPTISAGDRLIAVVMYDTFDGEKDRPLIEANAQFIVKAANCHNELLEACKNLVQNFKNGADNGVITQGKYEIITAQARQAIDKAENGVG